MPSSQNMPPDHGRGAKFGGRAPRYRRFRVSFLLCSVWLPAPPLAPQVRTALILCGKRGKGTRSGEKSAFTLSDAPES